MAVANKQIAEVIDVIVEAIPNLHKRRELFEKLQNVEAYRANKSYRDTIARLATANQDKTGAQEPEYVADTLAWCNSIRAQQGREPLDRLPKARRMDGASCPCGKATGLFVNTKAFGINDEEAFNAIFGRRNLLPNCVRSFVHAFDNGELPQYDEDIQ